MSELRATHTVKGHTIAWHQGDGPFGVLQVDDLYFLAGVNEFGDLLLPGRHGLRIADTLEGALLIARVGSEQLMSSRRVAGEK